DVDNMFYDTCESIVLAHNKNDFENFELELLRVIGIQSPVSKEEFATTDTLMMTEKVYQAMLAGYKRKNDKIAERVWPQIKHVHETMADRYKTIVVPLTDGKKEVKIGLDLEKSYAVNGSNVP